MRETESEGSLAPPRGPGPGYGWRSDMHWKLPAELHYTTWTGERTNAFIQQQHDAGRPLATLVPDASGPPLLPDAGFVLAPELEALARVRGGERLKRGRQLIF